MQAPLTIQKAVNGPKLLEELLAAIPGLAPTVDAQGRNIASWPPPSVTATAVTLTLPDGVDPTAVQNVVTAHNPNVQSASQAQAVQDTTDLTTLRTQYQQILTGIATIRGRTAGIQTDMTSIQNGPASPTAAQTGTALKLLAKDVAQIDTDFDATLNRLDQLVRALGALVRGRLGG